MRLIDAEDLYSRKFLSPVYMARANSKDLASLYQKGWNDAIDAIVENAPTIKVFTLEDVEKQFEKGLRKGLDEWETEIPKGHWERIVSNIGDEEYKCSVCKEEAIIDDWHCYVKSNFCPHCGALMKEGSDEVADDKHL